MTGVGGEAAATVEVERLRHPVAASSHRSCAAGTKADSKTTHWSSHASSARPHERLQLLDRVGQGVRVPEVPRDGLGAIEGQHHAVLRVRGARPRQDLLGTPSRVGQPQPAGLQHGQAAPEVGLGPAVAELGSEPDAVLERPEQARPPTSWAPTAASPPRARSAASSSRRSPLRRAHASAASMSSIAASTACRPRGPVPGPAVRAPGSPRPAPGRPRQRSTSVRASSTAAPRRACSAGDQPAARCAGVVAHRVRVCGHHLGPVTGEVRGPAVVGRGDRRRELGVHALLEEVVCELVDRTAPDEESAASELFPVAGGADLRQLGEARQQPRVEAPPQHGSGLDHRARLCAQPVDAGQHGGRQRGRHPGVAVGERPQALHDAERVAGRAVHDLALSGDRPAAAESDSTSAGSSGPTRTRRTRSPRRSATTTASLRTAPTRRTRAPSRRRER